MTPIRFLPRALRRACVAVLLSSAPLSTMAAAAQHLTLLTWEDYLSAEVIERWQARTGVAIEQIYFDTSDKRDEILARPDHHIDLVLTERVSSERFGARGMFDAISEKNLPNLKHLASPWRDRCGPYSVPYLWGTMGIAYRADRLAVAPDSWADLLRPAVTRPHVIMIEDHEDILAGPLIYLGQSINTADNDALKAAFEMLQAQAPAVLTYEYAITSLKAQRYLEHADMALAFSGDQHVLNEVDGVEGKPWRYVVPKEGTLLWTDCFSVPSRTPNKELAYRFLAFLAEPEIAALNAEALGVATPNDAAYSLLPERLREDRSIYPSTPVLQRSQVYEARPLESTQTRRRIISALINAHDAR
ncbi:polyamine ABC transporter substrate-binding protein [Stutzerimonas azotifigens]|uniref:Spermidine/putrescine ABC transporter substrate-binding protein n=1 Tax=Stutzerimonas azotifigens TaxID=291995 RepID=A0ABR5YZ51_9GAMM|nr:spermidine/putrescine ABC transporter substrate-binding protein [Stutzerimonas azotifigens]MBA1273217.1 spermidine/putrescine ABC transporter substrate-binding protein [Stutzerimonas azotifigens]